MVRVGPGGGFLDVRRNGWLDIKKACFMRGFPGEDEPGSDGMIGD